MSAFWKNLRRRPLAQRKRILTASVFIVTALVVGLWLAFLPARFKGNSSDWGLKEPVQFFKNLFSSDFNSP